MKVSFFRFLNLSLALSAAIFMTVPALAQEDLANQLEEDQEVSLTEGEEQSVLPDVEDVLLELVDESSATGFDEAAVNTLLDAVDLEATQLSMLSEEELNAAFKNGRFEKYLAVRDILKQYSREFTKEQRAQVKMMRNHIKTILKEHRRAMKSIRKSQMIAQSEGRKLGQKIRSLADDLKTLSGEERKEAVMELVVLAREQRAIVMERRMRMSADERDEFRSWCYDNTAECRKVLLERKAERDQITSRKNAELLRWCDRVSDADACRARLQERWNAVKEEMAPSTNEMSEEEPAQEETRTYRRR